MTLQERLALNGSRGPGFDHVRLAAATIVLFHHCRGLQHPDITDDLLHYYSRGYMDFGRFAVIIFFSISGFLVTPGLLKRGIIEYAIHRIVRIFPALIVTVLATMFLLGPLLTTEPFLAYFFDPTLYFYAKNLLTLTTRYLPGVAGWDGSPIIINGSLWTLYFEVLCYISLAVLSGLFLVQKRTVFFLSLLVVYALYIWISGHPEGSFVPERLATFLSLYIFFGSGVALYLFGDAIPFSFGFACAAVALLFIALPYGGALVMPICLPYVIIYCALAPFAKRFPLRHDLSYGVYLIHSPVMVAIGLYASAVRSEWVAAAALVFATTLVLSYLSWIYVENPALQRKKTISVAVRSLVDAAKRRGRRLTTGRECTRESEGSRS